MLGPWYEARDPRTLQQIRVYGRPGESLRELRHRTFETLRAKVYWWRFQQAHLCREGAD